MQYSIKYLAEQIRKAREKKGLSQRDLSAKSGITQSQISKFENGIVDLQISSLIELARSLDLELILIPHELIMTVKGIQTKDTLSTPAYRLDDEEEDEE